MSKKIWMIGLGCLAAAGLAVSGAIIFNRLGPEGNPGAGAPAAAFKAEKGWDLRDECDFSVKELTLRAKGRYKLTCAYEKERKKVKWKMADASVATANSDGTVRGKAKGETTLTAFYKGEPVITGVPVRVDRDPPPLPGDIAPPRYRLADGIYKNPESNGANRAVISLTGDLMCNHQQQQAARVGDTHDFSACFTPVKGILEKSDFVFGNLETTLSHTLPYREERKRILIKGKKKPYLNAPPAYLAALRHAGFDAVATANNHSADTGLQGVLETLQNLEGYGVLSSGMFSSAEESRFLPVEINGIRVAFLSYAEEFAGCADDIPPKDRETHLNLYSEGKVKSDVSAARAAGAEYIIAYMHWGPLNKAEPRKSQTKMAQEAANAGVDYIVGSHPHVLQKYDAVTAEDGRVVPVAYSLGNFMSNLNMTDADGNEYGNRDTVILQIELEKAEGGVRLAREGYIPCFIMTKWEGVSFVVVPCSAGGGDENAQKHLREARERVAAAMGGKIQPSE